MSFMERRISEYQTAPDVRRGGKTRRISAPLRGSGKTGASVIPVLERRKMFEQTDSGPPTAGFGSVGSRRGSKLRKEISRNTSFRGTKRLKTDESHSPIMGRAKQLGSAHMSLPMWKKLRNFGHFDLQSLAIDSISNFSGSQDEANVKKPTGASAAHGETGSVENGGLSNALVSECPAFTNEIGGDSDWLRPGNPIHLLRDGLSTDKQRRVGSRERMIMDGELPLKVLVQSRGPMNRQMSEVLFPKTGISYPLEFIDFGASYYRNYFLQYEHQNFFGVDESLGPIAISIRRERVPEQLSNFYGLQPSSQPKHMYRVIFRTSELSTLRGTILEEGIPTGAKTGTSKPIPPRDIVEYISQGEVQLSCLKLGKGDRKVLQELVRLDEQELNNKYKVGVIYCQAGQDTEEDMYNNKQGSDAFDEFLNLVGEKVRMKGFTKYRAQLDNKTDTTGEHSVYTEFKGAEVMFHVSTLLPHTESNKQQLLRKRHIGNDIVTIIFQEPGCEQFSPRCIRSHFQHIFIIVRAENPNTKHTKYRVAVSRSTDIPFFGPPIPEGAVFDKNENFRDFILTKVINACNASLRNQKFSTMAIRTRKQYLNDLAEHSITSTTIDQANTSGRVAGLLRNLGHKKKERMRQDSTLIFTGGALSWHVSIILRGKKPLPFSEDHDNHIECIMGIGPDIIVFVDYFTKETLLHIPTKDLSGWIVDRTRLNLFYEECYCVSLDCLDNEDDVREMITRMQAVAPKLTPSHEAISMEFRRSSAGFLGFTINEAGVVQRVDGLARNSGLQPNSRLLQVEDRLLCCHTHKQITDLLTAKDKPVVRAYVIPPPPTPRHMLYYPEVNWAALWASRPTHVDSDDNSCKVQNGVERSESAENGTAVEKRKKKHNRSHSHTNRLSYMEAMQTNELENSLTRPPNLIIDDDEPIYDRLGDKGMSKIPRSPHDSSNFRRVKSSHKATRESVMNLADDLMERGSKSSYDPLPMEHTVSEVDIKPSIQLTTSEQLPDRKPHQAAPLAPHHRRSGSRDLKRDGTKKPAIEITSPITPKGNVSQKKLMFSFNHGSSRIPPPSSRQSGSMPMKALASTSEMTKSGIPVKTTDANKTPTQNAINDSSWGDKVKLRQGNNKRNGRPASFDVALLINNEKNVIEGSKDDMMPCDDIEVGMFNRNTQIRTAFRKRSQSRELSPEPAEDESKAPGSVPTTEPVPRSPTTGALISGEEPEVFLSQEQLPEYDELRVEDKRLSQNTGSQGSQDSIKNPKLTVRERTQRWEARGGGLPSYFSTLPKSFRHKATDIRSDQYSYNPDSPTGEEQFFYEEEEAMHDVCKSYSSSRGSPSGIPFPSSKMRQLQPRSSLPLGISNSASRGVGGSKMMSPVRDEGARSVTSSCQDPSSNDSSLERKTGLQENGEMQSGIVKGRGFVAKGKSSLLPTRSLGLQVSSKKTGQTSDSDLARRSSVPVSSSGIPTRTTPSKLLSDTTARENSAPGLQRQGSGDSLEENFMELDRNLNDLLQRDTRRDRRARKGDTHIEEWLRQTSKDAVPPDMLGGSEPVTRDISSPTFTENSLNYSQASDYTQEMIESLRAKVEQLEARLDKESVSNQELRSKLSAAEQKLQVAECKRRP